MRFGASDDPGNRERWCFSVVDGEGELATGRPLDGIVRSEATPASRWRAAAVRAERNGNNLAFVSRVR